MILVTGASGFIGTHLTEALHEKNWPVVASGRSRPAFQQGPYIPAERLSDYVGHIDCVVHLAGRAHVSRDASPESAAKFRAANVGYLADVARAVALRKCRRFILVSSIGVLGDGTLPNLPFTHTSTPCPENEYTQSKLEAELELRKLAEETGMEYVVIRPPLVYGSGAKGNFANMMNWLRRGVPLPLGGVQNRRSLVSVENLIDLILRSIEHPAAANSTFLVADGEDVSTTELLKRTALAMNKPARLFPMPDSWLSTVLRRSGNSQLAQQLLGSLEVDIGFTCRTLDWGPPLSLDAGLSNAAKEYRRRI